MHENAKTRKCPLSKVQNDDCVRPLSISIAGSCSQYSRNGSGETCWKMWLCVVSLFSVVCADELLTRNLSLGPIHGKLITTPNGVESYAFQGIPYAEPPIGDLRFKAPQFKKPWLGKVLETTSYRKNCIYNSSASPLAMPYDELSEDCLYMNVFTSKNCLESKNCSVLFFIHGGAWKSEGPKMLKAETIVENFLPEDRNIVVVTIAYRLGFLGMINLAPEIEGWDTLKNIGLHDQLVALQFVNREIHNFGGDPAKITLMGHSSGAVDAYSLYISPKTDNLISQIIIMSSAYGDQENKPDTNTATCRKIAEYLNCAKEDTDYSYLAAVEKVLDCLENVPVETLVDAQRSIEDTGLHLMRRAADARGPDPIFPSGVSQLIKQSKALPMLVGTTGKELGFSYDLVKNGIVDVKLLEGACAFAISDAMSDNMDEARKHCVEHYGDPSRARFLLDDLYFFTSAYTSAEANYDRNPQTYLYQFDYADIGDAYYVKPGFTLPHDKEPYHGQELVYLLGLYQGNFTPKDVQIQKDWSQLIVSFINTGNPEFEAEPFHPGSGNYLSVDFDKNGKMTPAMKTGYHADAVNFWSQYKEKPEECSWNG
ncbi:hypothetical protein L596_016748 [Steinernema carpocapsae]|uniref:Carboxylic ester hydrolase n=1 Tax=Steinernema carpocapsae TaxID=34508 RepID=A0A4U5NJW3_STECR|nr:hypothetical protein L596_016748 [Steinernema carpocapsae]